MVPTEEAAITVRMVLAKVSCFMQSRYEFVMQAKKIFRGTFPEFTRTDKHCTEEKERKRKQPINCDAILLFSFSSVRKPFELCKFILS
jgi:hypothetical protein